MPYTGISLTLEKKARLANLFTHLFESMESVLPRKDHYNSNKNNNTDEKREATVQYHWFFDLRGRTYQFPF